MAPYVAVESVIFHQLPTSVTRRNGRATFFVSVTPSYSVEWRIEAMSHSDGGGMALVARTAAFVYIYARIPQTAEMPLSVYATELKLLLTAILRMADKSNVSTLSITGLEHEIVELMKH